MNKHINDGIIRRSIANRPDLRRSADMSSEPLPKATPAHIAAAEETIVPRMPKPDLRHYGLHFRPE